MFTVAMSYRTIVGGVGLLLLPLLRVLSTGGDQYNKH